MDPLTLLAVFGANVVGNKLQGQSTSDALKGSILPTAMAAVPGAGNPFTSFAAQQGLSGAASTAGTSALKQLLIDRAKQFAAQKVGEKVGTKIGIDPNIAGSLASSFASSFAMPTTDSIMLSAAKKGGVDNNPALKLSKDQLMELGKKYMNSEALQMRYKSVGDYQRFVAEQMAKGKKIPTGGKMDAFKDLFKTEGKYDIDKIAKGATLFGVPALLYASGAFAPQDKKMIMPTYLKNYPELRERRGGLKRINPLTGQEETVDMVPIPETGSRGDPYEYSERTFKAAKGGIAQALPSKSNHDENDASNYMRAGGYVIDGNGAGDKNEDTMLAQLADGEFVTRTDGVLGAGILAGANPKDEKDMRDKGAKYFYDQQARFKRVYDLLNANRAATVQ